MFTFLLLQDAGVHALSNVCHVDVERISKRKPGEVVCHQSVITEVSS
jgi:tRNA U38,U39,U40 pseudouridine synthase TruA